MIKDGYSLNLVYRHLIPVKCNFTLFFKDFFSIKYVASLKEQQPPPKNWP